jgi:hypothetical protein
MIGPILSQTREVRPPAHYVSVKKVSSMPEFHVEPEASGVRPEALR